MVSSAIPGLEMIETFLCNAGMLVLISIGTFLASRYPFEGAVHSRKIMGMLGIP